MIATDLLLSLLAPLSALPAASALGALARRRGEDLPAELHAAAAFALTLLVAQAGAMLLATAGALHAGPVMAWLALGVAGAFAFARGIAVPRLDRAYALGLVLVAGYLLLATVPPWDRDEMVYHLAIPREMARAGAWVRPDDNIFASLPLGWESVTSVLFALGRHGEPLFNPRLLGAWTACAAALAAAALARELGASRPWVASFGLLLVPTFVEFGASAYVEAYLTLLVTLSLVLVVRARGEVLAAVLAGAAASVKYPGLAALALLSVLARPRAIRFLGLALVVASPFYLRNLVQRHNPFFPLAFDLFGGDGWDATRAAAYWETLRAYGSSDDLVESLALPLRVFFTRDLERGLQGSIGPVVALGFLALPRAARDRRFLVVSVFATGFFVYWMATVRQARFLLPAVPAMLALGAAMLDSLGERAGAAAAVAIAGSAAWGAGLFGELWSRQQTTAWITGAVDRDTLLARQMPESYRPLRELDGLVPPTGRVWLLWMRAHTFYLDRPYKLDCVFEAWRFEALLEEEPDDKALLAALERDGVTHLLANGRFFLAGKSAETTPGRTARLRKRFDDLVRRGAFVSVKEWGPVTLYAVAHP